MCYDEGTSDKLLDEFYQLLTTTRRRHHIPPQSKASFPRIESLLKGRFQDSH